MCGIDLQLQPVERQPAWLPYSTAIIRSSSAFAFKRRVRYPPFGASHPDHEENYQRNDAIAGVVGEFCDYCHDDRTQDGIELLGDAEKAEKLRAFAPGHHLTH